ncbi:Heat shock 70 kDa protein 12B [Mytilus edulis]|uniref:Heat shock 70 kDa protein 12B n=1 Tax=Mytilus edulis TaxID=6550 RepID=A0A8S3SAM3_MYTED|nr:Heat shock 70 kDa protein 12B [Mytilus edulis]
MSTKKSNVTEYTLQLQNESILDKKGDADDEVSSIDEFEDAVEYMDDTDTLSSAQELENLIEVVDDINSVSYISMPINTNEVSNTLHYDDIEVSSSLDYLEIADQPTCTEDGNVVVVAIDFGTTYSGWAFSLRQKFKDDKLDIQIKNGWQSGDGLVTPKVPTCILYNENEEFNSFGYEAENKYAELIDDNIAGDWRYFSTFKMSLFCDDNAANMGLGKITSRYKIKDVNGYRMSALKVFADTLRFLKNNVIEALELKISSIPLQYISWVVTVPAIWTDKAKQFMRLAALEAGIPGTQLTLAYEPEAAALYCRESTYQRKGQLIGPISTFGTGESPSNFGLRRWYYRYNNLRDNGKRQIQRAS